MLCFVGIKDPLYRDTLVYKDHQGLETKRNLDYTFVQVVTMGGSRGILSHLRIREWGQTRSPTRIMDVYVSRTKEV